MDLTGRTAVIGCHVGCAAAVLPHDTFVHRADPHLCIAFPHPLFSSLLNLLSTYIRTKRCSYGRSPSKPSDFVSAFWAVKPYCHNMHVPCMTSVKHQNSWKLVISCGFFRYSAVLGYRLSIPMRSLGWAPYKWNVLWEWVPFSFHSISLSLILALSVTLVSCPNGQLFPKPSSLCTSSARTSRTSIRQHGKPLF